MLVLIKSYPPTALDEKSRAPCSSPLPEFLLPELPVQGAHAIHCSPVLLTTFLVTEHPVGCHCMDRVWPHCSQPCPQCARVLLPWGGLMVLAAALWHGLPSLAETIPCFSMERVHPRAECLAESLSRINAHRDKWCQRHKTSSQPLILPLAFMISSSSCSLFTFTKLFLFWTVFLQHTALTAIIYLVFIKNTNNLHVIQSNDVDIEQ